MVRYEMRKEKRDGAGGELQRSGEGLSLWKTLNFPVAMLSFTSWTLTSVLRFEEVQQYLNLN